MRNESLIGTWLLVGSSSIQDEIRLIGEEPDLQGVAAWLAGNGDERLATIAPTTGLTLTIQADGQFTEEKVGDPKVDWFSAEGVLEPSVMPFNGVISWVAGVAYLLLTQPIARTIPQDAGVRQKLRYDDGDTKIADWIEVHGEQLVRTVSVVTDELYLNRVVLVYDKATSEPVCQPSHCSIKSDQAGVSPRVSPKG